jgi:hypothetical protein
MTAAERMQMLSDAQEKLEKMLQAEKQQIDDTKREINNRFGSMTTPGGARPSYKEIQQQRRDTKKKETAVAIGTVPVTSDEQLFNELEKKLATGKMEFGGSFPSVSHSPKSTKQELRNTFS